MSAFTRALSSALIRSVLLSRIMSAQRSWSSKTSSSGLSCSTDGSAARWAASASGSSAKKPAATAGPSTTAITPSTVTRERIAGQLKAVTSGFGRARPEVSIRMCSGGFGPVEKFRERRHEIVRDRAADAAVRQFDDVVLGAAADAAALDERAVEADIAELVDQHRQTPALGVLEEVAHERGFAGAEEAGHDGAGDLGEVGHEVLSDGGKEKVRAGSAQGDAQSREGIARAARRSRGRRGSSVIHLLGRSDRAGSALDGRVRHHELPRTRPDPNGPGTANRTPRPIGPKEATRRQVSWLAAPAPPSRTIVQWLLEQASLLTVAGAAAA